MVEQRGEAVSPRALQAELARRVLLCSALGLLTLFIVWQIRTGFDPGDFTLLFALWVIAVMMATPLVMALVTLALVRTQAISCHPMLYALGAAAACVAFGAVIGAAVTDARGLTRLLIDLTISVFAGTFAFMLWARIRPLIVSN